VGDFLKGTPSSGPRSVLPTYRPGVTWCDLWDVLPHAAFLWLLAGGIFYTIGGVIYALKVKVFGGRFPYFGAHEVFHVFVMLGSICHFIFMFRYVA